MESSRIDVEFFKDEWITFDGYALFPKEHTTRQAVPDEGKLG